MIQAAIVFHTPGRNDGTADVSPKTSGATSKSAGYRMAYDSHPGVKKDCRTDASQTRGCAGAA